MTIISNVDYRLEWASTLDSCLEAVQNAEGRLAYLGAPRCEIERKHTGSYYTPADAAHFFWNEYFSLTNRTSREDFLNVLRDHEFIEPAVGGGALVFALFRKLLSVGLSPDEIAIVRLTMVDLNESALDFVQSQITFLETSWGVHFDNLFFRHSDYMKLKPFNCSGRLLVFGNPPFVTNPKGSRWRNMFADFMERALDDTGTTGSVHFIVPLSATFGRDYARLRVLLRQSRRSIAVSSFDNVPNALFLGGKPGSHNTNKANSQRCSIVTVFPESIPRILSSRLHRWKKCQRRALLSNRPLYHEVTDYSFNDQIPRPENLQILRYLGRREAAKPFGVLLDRGGSHVLFVASVARNFIGVRDESSSSVHRLTFRKQDQWLDALLIVTSDLFFDYWRTVGDGFHLTRSNIVEFPLTDDVLTLVQSQRSYGKRMWRQRQRFIKEKAHPGGVTKAYDFTSVRLTILDKSLQTQPI